MISFIQKQHPSKAYKFLNAFIAVAFMASMVVPPQRAQAQTVLNLPVPGVMVPLSNGFTPTLVRGITLNPNNPLEFDFLVDTGDTGISGEELRVESNKLIKYFLASLTVPEDEMWVNLSPYEKDRIIPDGFGVTEMGRDLLAQDYMLKQLTASLMFPDENIGNNFWQRVYSKAQARFGTTDIPLNTFNKIWIVPQKAVIYQKGNSAYIVESHLKVMLEEDYIALQRNLGNEKFSLDSVADKDAEKISEVTSGIIKEILIPEIEKEVNEGQTFANLRQIYNSVILAQWYKDELKQSLLGQVYADKNKTAGIDVEDKDIKQKIYNQYLAAFKTGVYDYIKEDYDPKSGNIIPRKYFSGGAEMTTRDVRSVISGDDAVASPQLQLVRSFADNVEAGEETGRVHMVTWDALAVNEDVIAKIGGDTRTNYLQIAAGAESVSIPAAVEAQEEEDTAQPQLSLTTEDGTIITPEDRRTRKKPAPTPPQPAPASQIKFKDAAVLAREFKDVAADNLGNISWGAKNQKEGMQELVDNPIETLVYVTDGFFSNAVNENNIETAVFRTIFKKRIRATVDDQRVVRLKIPAELALDGNERNLEIFQLNDEKAEWRLKSLKEIRILLAAIDQAIEEVMAPMSLEDIKAAIHRDTADYPSSTIVASYTSGGQKFSDLGTTADEIIAALEIGAGKDPNKRFTYIFDGNEKASVIKVFDADAAVLAIGVDEVQGYVDTILAELNRNGVALPGQDPDTSRRRNFNAIVSDVDGLIKVRVELSRPPYPSQNDLKIVAEARNQIITFLNDHLHGVNFNSIDARLEESDSVAVAEFTIDAAIFGAKPTLKKLESDDKYRETAEKLKRTGVVKPDNDSQYASIIKTAIDANELNAKVLNNIFDQVAAQKLGQFVINIDLLLQVMNVTRDRRWFRDASAAEMVQPLLFETIQLLAQEGVFHAGNIDDIKELLMGETFQRLLLISHKSTRDGFVSEISPPSIRYDQNHNDQAYLRFLQKLASLGKLTSKNVAAINDEFQEVLAVSMPGVLFGESYASVSMKAYSVLTRVYKRLRFGELPVGSDLIQPEKIEQQ